MLRVSLYYPMKKPLFDPKDLLPVRELCRDGTIPFHVKSAERLCRIGAIPAIKVGNAGALPRTLFAITSGTREQSLQRESLLMKEPPFLSRAVASAYSLPKRRRLGRPPGKPKAAGKIFK